MRSDRICPVVVPDHLLVFRYYLVCSDPTILSGQTCGYTVWLTVWSVRSENMLLDSTRPSMLSVRISPDVVFPSEEVGEHPSLCGWIPQTVGRTRSPGRAAPLLDDMSYRHIKVSVA
jgi:hypothetical protein